MQDRPGDRRRLNPWLVAPWLGVLTLLALWPRGEVARSRKARRLTAPAFDAWEPGRGRAARKPGEIPRRGWRDILWRTWTETGRDRLQMVAAGCTFYALLAMFPGMGAFVALYGLFADVGEVREQLQTLARLLPPGSVDFFGQEMMRLATTHHASLSTAFGVSLALSIWSANAGMKALFDGLNIAYDEPEKRGYVRRTLITLGFTAGAVVFMLLVSGLMVGAPIAFQWLGLRGVDLWWLPLVWVMVFAIAVTAFSVVYRYGPSREHARWRWVTWGGVFAAAAWIVGSVAFSAYVGNFAHYDRTYGSLGAFVGFMVWLWFSIFMVLLGAELNAEIEHQTAVDTTTGRPEILGARGAMMADTVGLSASRRNINRIRRRPAHLWAAVRRQMGWSP